MGWNLSPEDWEEINKHALLFAPAVAAETQKQKIVDWLEGFCDHYPRHSRYRRKDCPTCWAEFRGE